MCRCKWVVAVAVLFGWVSAVSGQPADDGGTSPYFDCPYVNFFDTDCPQLGELGPAPQEQQVTPESQPGAGWSDEQDSGENQENTGQGVLPDELILFPRESLAPDAPPLFRLLLANPTLANARRYVRWHARRSAQLQAVQALIQRAGKELETSPVPALRPVVRTD